MFREEEDSVARGDNPSGTPHAGRKVKRLRHVRGRFSAVKAGKDTQEAQKSPRQKQRHASASGNARARKNACGAAAPLYRRR